MKYLIRIMSLIGLFSISQFAYSASITDTYATGDTLTAETLNRIKSAVNNSDTRVNILESLTPGVNPDYSGYSLPFAADGDPKNVVILARNNNDGTTWYNVQVRYANSSQQISVEGAPVIRPFIADWFSISVDAGGNLTSLQNFLEAPLTTNYIDSVMENSTYDVSTLVKTVDDDTRSEFWDCNGGGAISDCDVDVKISGVSDNTESFTSMKAYSLLGSGTINSVAYPDLRGAQNTYITGLTYRVKAKGIGDVMRLQSGQKARKAIYYRVNGSTGGSLAGTIFAPGEKLDGVLF
jgi:hypothetical protein